MSEADAQHGGYLFPSGQSRHPGARPSEPDAREPADPRLPGEIEGDDGLIGDAFPPAGSPAAEWWQRVRTRRLLREFLRAVPRSEPDVTIVLTSPDGSPHVLTRGALTAAIERLRPRQRQIVRLAIEERWPRQRVCAYLNNISEKTLERDQVEALDLLAEL
jgi:hypothetical protein